MHPQTIREHRIGNLIFYAVLVSMAAISAVFFIGVLKIAGVI